METIAAELVALAVAETSLCEADWPEIRQLNRSR
jgi:hypothetical protein